MHETELYRLIVDPISTLGIRYIVTGSVAGGFYGEPRYTNDVDIILELPLLRISDFAKLFPANEFYCPPEEILKTESMRPNRGHFNLIHIESGYKADIYLLGDDPAHAWALDHIKFFEFDSHKVAVAPVEYVIFRKLEFFSEGRSEKHLRDIRSILKEQKQLKRQRWLEVQIAAQGLQEVWKEVLNTDSK